MGPGVTSTSVRDMSITRGHKAALTTPRGEEMDLPALLQTTLTGRQISTHVKETISKKAPHQQNRWPCKAASLSPLTIFKYIEGTLRSTTSV